jgi:hypothetical protein
MTNIYWANKPLQEIGSELISRVDKYYDFLRSSARLELWRRSYRAHFAGALDLGQVKTGGTNGEVVLLKANHVRNLAQHICQMITSQRPSFECKAVNSDHASMTQAQLAQGILEYDLREKRLEAVAKAVVDSAIQFGEGWATKLWDATGGDDYAVDPETQAPIKTGTLRFRAYTPIDVIRDFTQDDPKQTDWVILRRWVNKYTLMAKYPELAEKISGCPTKFEATTKHATLAETDRSAGTAEYSDEIEVFDFFHEKTVGSRWSPPTASSTTGPCPTGRSRPTAWPPGSSSASASATRSSSTCCRSSTPSTRSTPPSRRTRAPSGCRTSSSRRATRCR